ncbi:MAG: alkaline phosphatase family protein [Candidatus Aureabacteria bacterium]|nr:alkaline phosphatase family protein [Candidatus Auribacterota bacterium]
MRAMYLLTTLDTFVFFGALPAALALGMQWRNPLSWAALASAYALFKLCRFFPSPLLGLPLYFLLLRGAGGLSAHASVAALGLVCVITLGIQQATQALPHMIASRDPTVPLRMLFNSLWTIAPTTLSLPVSVGFGGLLAWAGIAGPASFSSRQGWTFWVLLAAAALYARSHAPRTFIPAYQRPAAPLPRAYRRVVLLNIDGLSLAAYRRAAMPFVKGLAARYAEVDGGAITVCRALTNPAFASILTGAPPPVHGVVDNNLGQPIRCEALPDTVPARLYGSMHVKHFSKPNWNVTVVSLVRDGALGAERKLFAALREDIRALPDIRLFIADISTLDFTGHSYGHYSRRCLEAASAVDSLIGGFWEWMETERFLRDTAVIISSDHGLFVVEHSYLMSRTETYVPLIFAGPGIARGVRIGGPVSIMDINPSVSYLLGARYCARSTGRVLTEALEGG